MHRVHVPEEPDGSSLILLHGTGGNEASLLPLARRLAPRARLIGLRGRSHEEGVARFFRRFDATTFDQKDIGREAAAFEAFVEGAVPAYDLDPGKIVFLGYSNGANLLGAAMLLHPGVIERAILLRGTMVLEEVRSGSLGGSHVLILTGRDDLYAACAEQLAEALLSAGADVDQQLICAGHGLAAEDETAADAWLASHR